MEKNHNCPNFICRSITKLQIMKTILESHCVHVWFNNYWNGMCEISTKFTLIFEYYAHVGIQGANFHCLYVSYLDWLCTTMHTNEVWANDLLCKPILSAVIVHLYERVVHINFVVKQFDNEKLLLTLIC